MNGRRKTPGLGSLSSSLKRQLEASIRRQHRSGQSNRDLAQEFGVHPNTIANYRRRLREIGVLDGGYGTTARPRTDLELVPFAISDVKELLDRLPSMRALTGEERMKLLSHLATNAADSVKVQAIKALEELERAEHARRKVEANVPRTDRERLERLRVLRECVGPELWAQADTAERERGAQPDRPSKLQVR